MKPKEETKPKTRPPVIITSFDQLRAIVDEPVMACVEFNEQEVQIPCNRLTTAAQERIRAVLRAPKPPLWNANKPDAGYDTLNAKYREEADLAEAQARSMTIYFGCPSLAAQAKTPLAAAREIHDFITGLQLPEVLVEVLSLTIQKGGMSLRERTDFTSSAGLEN